ncbi:MAG: exodeoxyribonuclease V subunit beta [Spirochaetes bacterium]|nr:exodeoxyribonuclease V subunit beta [Spirochaetota bacterium]
MIKFDILNCPLKGSNLIEASAGTGKTYNITGLYLRILLESPGNISIEKILVVTYTKAATAELRDRIFRKLTEAYNSFRHPEACLSQPDCDPLIAKLVKDSIIDENVFTRRKAILEYSLRNFDEASIFTIHGFCQRILTENAFEGSAMFSSRLQTDIKDIQNEIINDYLRRKFYKTDLDYLDIILKKKNVEDNRKILQNIINEIENKPFLKIKQLYKPVNYSKISEKLLSEAISILQKTNLSMIEMYFIQNRKAYNAGRLRDKTIQKHTAALSSLKNSDNLTVNKIIYASESFNYFSENHILSALNKNYEYPHEEFFSKCEKLLPLINAHASAGVQLNHNFKIEFTEYYKSELSKRKAALQIRTYSDLLNEIYDAVKGSNSENFIKAVRRKYFAVMVDEFQDTDMLQLEIFNVIFNSRKTDNLLFFIGDPKQSIYNFRGADLSAYLRSKNYTENIYTLYENYRSHERIVKSVNVFFSRKDPFITPEITYTQNNNIIQNNHLIEDGRNISGTSIIFFDDLDEYNTEKLEERSTEYCAGKIAEILKKSLSQQLYFEISSSPQKITPSDIAVLVRTNKQGERIKNSLSQYGINSVIKSEKNIFDTAEAVELYYILNSIAYPSDRNRYFTALTTAAFNYSLSDFERLETNEDLLHEILLNLQNYNKIWENSGFIAMFKNFLKQNNVKQNLASQNNGLRKITNYLHLSELIHIREKEAASGISSLLSWFHSQIFDENSRSENTLRLESDDDAVQICTIHKSKGLEYNIVFIPFLWKDSLTRKGQQMYSFHDTEGNSILSFDEDDSENPEYIKEIISESMRLAYVALTRAKYKNYIIFGKLSSGSLKQSFQITDYFYLKKIYPDYTKYLNQSSVALKDISNEQIRQHLKEFSMHSQESIIIESSEIFPSDSISIKPGKQFSFLKNQRIIKDNWRITSYSYLSSSNKSTHNHYPEKLSEPDDVEPENINLAEFPPGAKGGNCIHEIFESINFNNPDNHEPEVLKTLQKYNFDEIHLDTILQMIDNVLKFKMSDGINFFSLSQLSNKDYRNEIEFYFPILNISAEKIINTVNMQYPDFGKDSSLNFSDISGFLKGYIDLIFHINGKYYILDWKTNYLGSNVSDYTRLNIKSAMDQHLYYLQYLIYTAAADKYLKNRIVNYSYEKNFGGVFYFFVRGIKKENTSMNGVYFDKPDKLFLNNFMNLLKQENLK